MVILSHRGFWKRASEMNSLEAFKRSFSEGFGTELDVRDMNGTLVVSHDPPTGSPLRLEDLFDVYNSYSSDFVLALNIKADGLQPKLKKLIKQFSINNYFVFDMSVPEGLRYSAEGFRTFTRHSEQELVPSFYDQAHGVWLDEFYVPWITREVVLRHVSSGKQVCIVSPELHKLNPKLRWQLYREIEPGIPSGLIMICTDYPRDAQEFFNA